MKQQYKILFFLFLFLFSNTAKVAAHHSGHSSSGTRIFFYQGTQTKPTSSIYGIYDFSKIDQSIGQIYTWTLGGEWAIHQKISLLGQIPISFLDHHFKKNTASLGDLSLGGKLLVLDRERFFSFVSTLWSFPTGDEQEGLSRKSISQQLTAFAGLKHSDWTFFFTPSISLGYNSPHEPLVNLGLGVNTPKIKERLYFALATNTKIFSASNVFDNGSWKLFLEPQINWTVDRNEKLTLSLSGNIALVDQLSRKSGTTLSPTSNALLNDVGWGLSFGAYYAF